MTGRPARLLQLGGFAGADAIGKLPRDREGLVDRAQLSIHLGAEFLDLAHEGT